MSDVRLPSDALPSSTGSFLGFPGPSQALEKFGFKFSPGGAHISRTMMLTELAAVLDHVAVGASVADYRDAVLQRNVLGKTTDSTRQKSLRHLRELYALDEATPAFALLRALHAIDAASLPLLAFQVAWLRDPLLRATTPAVLDAADGQRVETASLGQALNAACPGQYSELNRNKVARNAASSWTQAGHLKGRAGKVRQRVSPSAAVVTMALLLAQVSGNHGAALFSSAWCRLLDLNPERARSAGLDAHRAGFLNMRAVGEIVEVTFPRFTSLLNLHP